MEGSNAPRTRRTARLWPAIATFVLVLAACTQGPATSSLTASEGGEPSLASGPIVGASASESEEPSPSITQSGSLTGTWNGTWAIDGYGNTGDFTMELAPSGDGYSGPIESTNTDCPTGTVDLTLDGSSVTMGWVLSGVPVSFTGTREGNSMSGTWSAVSCSQNIPLTGTWEATKP